MHPSQSRTMYQQLWSASTTQIIASASRVSIPSALDPISISASLHFAPHRLAHPPLTFTPLNARLSESSPAHLIGVSGFISLNGPVVAGAQPSSGCASHLTSPHFTTARAQRPASSRFASSLLLDPPLVATCCIRLLDGLGARQNGHLHCRSHHVCRTCSATVGWWCCSGRQGQESSAAQDVVL